MLEVREQVPLAAMTTFEIGGAARYFVDVRDENEIKEAVALAHERGVPYVVLSGGSNVLVPDEGLNALVIRIVSDQYSFNGDTLISDAGCNLLALIREAGKRGLGGWEKLAGIPGTIGGAVRGNAGAFGPEIKDFVASVRAFNPSMNQYRDFVNPDMDFSYRHSFFKDHPEWIIVRATMRLNLIGSQESAALVEATIAEREKRHLQNVRAAGSYFMNPIAPQNIIDLFEQEKGVKSRGGRVPAGWLIEKAGMKGATVGGAIASVQHPNYLVNQGNATAADVKELAAKVRAAVESKFGVRLEEEAAVL